MAVKVIKEKCKSCGVCLEVCPVNAIKMVDDIAEIQETCVQCGLCVKSCPFEAIEKELEAPKLEKKEINVSEYKGVWVFAEQRQGRLMDVVFELLGEGRKLADELQVELAAILCGNKVEKLAKQLIQFGADKVYIANHSLLENYTTDNYTDIIFKAIEKYKPEIVLLGATHIGRDLAPCLAVKANTGLTADCTHLEIDQGTRNLKQTRPAFGGNLMATIICPKHRPQMSTVRAGVMDRLIIDKNRKGELIELDIDISQEDQRVKVLDIIKNVKERVSISEAEVIVAGGMGLGSKKGFELLKELANKLDGSIAASRACVDVGWIDSSYQVGQTGKTVKPKLYIACGISGAIQHIAGMQNSDYIVAINTNEQAPIFEIADYGIVGDLYDVIPQMIQVLNE